MMMAHNTSGVGNSRSQRKHISSSCVDDNNEMKRNETMRTEQKRIYKYIYIYEVFKWENNEIECNGDARESKREK